MFKYRLVFLYHSRFDTGVRLLVKYAIAPNKMQAWRYYKDVYFQARLLVCQEM